ncbi:MAG: tetrapyrrole methylase [Candidatus Electrothrix sp. LOE1_4_5]|nr:tetrapyrrole methylase [Candidatus Electrothrix gigas]
MQGTVWGKGRFYIIGTGPSGPQMATLQALETIKQMDAIIAPAGHAERFADYIVEKPVLFDPWQGFWEYKGRPQDALSEKERKAFNKERFRLRDERINKIKELLAEGKDVGLLDSGNPSLFGPSHWYIEHFAPEDLVIIPGMGCDAAAMAVLGKSIIPAYDTRFVMQTAPFFLTDSFFQTEKNKDAMQVLKDLADYPVSMVLYMALKKPIELFAQLKKIYPADMPCAVVYWAGYPDKQRVVRGTVADMGQKLAQDKEKFMGLLFIGRFLEGKPYEAAMKRWRSND